MRVSRKYVVMIFAAILTLCAVGTSCGDGGGAPEYDEHGGYIDDYSGYDGTTHYPGINATLNMAEDPPCLEKKSYSLNKTRKIPFQYNGECWVIEHLPKGTKFTVPAGCRVRCVSYHTQAEGGKGKPAPGDFVIYSGGTTVMYTSASVLYVYKN